MQRAPAPAPKKKARPLRRVERMEAVADQLIALAGPSKRARLMVDVEGFRSVPTELRSLNRVLKVGGAPLSCVWLIHGPPGSGKTVLLVVLMKAFARIQGLSAFVDAEHALDTKEWVPNLGLDMRKTIYIGRTDEKKDVDPMTYEEVVNEVEGLIARYRKMRREAVLAPHIPMLIGVDSISKMVPADLLKKLSQRGEKKGGDALKGGVGRLQALLNTAWLASLGPVVGNLNILFAIIAHEMESSETWGSDFKVRGGGSVIYDSMVQARVTYAGQVKDKSGSDAPKVGKRHRVTLLRNKHGPAFGYATFYTSDGSGACPIGLDHVRELVHEAMHRKLIDSKLAEEEGEEGKFARINLLLSTPVVWDGSKFKLGDFYDPQNERAIAVLGQIRDALDSTVLEA